MQGKQRALTTFMLCRKGAMMVTEWQRGRRRRQVAG